MSIKNRFYKTTNGVPFEFAIGKQLAGAQTNTETFITGGTLYDLAAFIVDKPKPTGIAFNSAMSAANKKKLFFLSFIEKQVGGINSIANVTPMVGDSITAELIAYKAPQLQVSTLAQSAGTISVNQLLTFKVVETTPGNIPLPTWDYTQPLTFGQATALSNIATQINKALESEWFTAAVLAYTAPVLANAVLSSGAVASSAVTSGGSGIVTASLPNGTGTIPLVITGNGTGATGVANVVNGIVTSTTITAGGSGYSGTVTVAIAAQTVLPGITITSTDANRHFRIVASVLPTKADPADYGVTYTYSTSVNASAGSGTLQQILDLQTEANVRRGIGHYYPVQNAVASEFGLPTDVATLAATSTWDIVVLKGYKSEDSPTPNERHTNKHYIFVAVPAGLGTQIAAIFA